MVKVVKCIIFIYYVNELVTFSNGETSGNKILQYTILQKDLFLRDYTKNTENPCTYNVRKIDPDRVLDPFVSSVH